MANRFRTAIKNAGGEILAAGKQAELIYKDDSFSELIELKTVESNAIDSSREEEDDVTSLSKNIYVDKKFTLISTFLKEKVGNYIFELRINKLKEILNTLLNQEETQKPILLTDYKVNMNNWIEAIEIAVPESIKSLLTFTTSKNKFSDDYEDCIIYNNAKPDSDKIALVGNNSEFYIFDFTKTIRSEVVNYTQYAELVQIGFLNNDARFHEFKIFFDELKYKKFNSNIDNCLMLYYFTLTGIEHLDYTSIVQALAFAEKHCSVEVYKKLFNKANATLNLSEEMASMVINLMLKVSKDIGEKEYYAKAYGFMFDYLQKLLKDSKNNDLTHIYDFYYNLNKLNESEFVINDETIIKLSEYVVNVDTKFSVFYLTVILEILNLKKYPWKSNLIYTDFIEKGMNSLIDDFESVKTVINSLGDNIEYKANLIVIYYNITKDDEYKSRQIIEFYSEIEKEYKQGVKDIRRFMTRIPEGTVLVFNEFKQSFENSSNKIDFFWEYKSNVFDKISKFKEEYLSTAMELYLKTIKDEPFYNDEWTKVLSLISNNQITLEDKVLTFFIEDYENRVPLVGADIVTQVNLKDISRIKKSRNIVTSNANVLMIEFGKNIKIANTSEQISDIINNKFPEFKGISKGKVEEFFQWCLDLLINNTNSEKNHLFGFYNKIIEELKDDSQDFELVVLSSENLAKFKVSLDKKNIKKVVFYLQITIELLIKRGATWDNQGEIEAFIKDCITILSNSKELIEYCLKKLVEHAEYYAQVFSIYAYCVKSSEVFLPLFLKKSSVRGEEWSQEIRKCLDKCENGDLVLFEEFKFKLEAAPDKSIFFWEYMSNIFGELKNYLSCKLDNAFELYLLHIEKNNNYTEECFNILTFLIENKLYIKKIILTKIICKYEETISLAPPTEELENFLISVAKYKIDSDVLTVPDITEIANFTFELEHLQKGEEIIDLLQKSSLNFKGIEGEKYSNYIEWCLSLISKNLNVMEQGDLLSKVFCISEFKDKYYVIYHDVIVRLLDSQTENLSKEQIHDLIIKHGNVLEIVAKLMTLYYKKCLNLGDKRDAVSLFVKLVNNSKSFNLKNTSLEILKYFSEFENGSELIFEEYKYRLETEKNKMNFFTNYWNQLDYQFEEYKKNYYSKALKCYLTLIKDINSYSEVCYQLLEVLKEENVDISQDILLEIVVASEKMILIASPTPQQNKIITNILEAKAKWGIVISPDIISCIKLGSALDGLNNEEEIRKVVNGMNIDLSNIDYTRYEEWLYWCLPNVKYAVNTWRMHASITKAFCANNLKNIFFTTYIGVLGDELNKNEEAWVDIFGKFMLFFMNDKDKIGEETYIQARSNITNMLSRCNSSQIYELDKVIIMGGMDLLKKQEVAIEWIQIQKRFTPATRQEKGFFSKVFKK